MSIKNIRPSKGTFIQGYYTPLNESKYVGPKPIVFRSSWEKKMCMYCDEKTEIVKWSSEPIKIRYVSPIDNKVHNYYPDFYNIKPNKFNNKYNIINHLLNFSPRNFYSLFWILTLQKLHL